MLRSSEDETEILLGNKQLLGIFFVVAILLGIAFTGGYMVGRGSGAKQPVSTAATQEPASSSAPTGTGGETHSVAPETGTSPDLSSSAASSDTQAKPAQNATQFEEPPLGSPQRKSAGKVTAPQPETATPAPAESFLPQSGQEFLQVAATGRDEAEAVADVLHKKGFRAHAVPKPGNSKIYRVLIGPIRDAGDLSSTRDALRGTGFREVIVQRY